MTAPLKTSIYWYYGAPEWQRDIIESIADFLDENNMTKQTVNSFVRPTVCWYTDNQGHTVCYQRAPVTETFLQFRLSCDRESKGETQRTLLVQAIDPPRKEDFSPALYARIVQWKIPFPRGSK